MPQPAIKEAWLAPSRQIPLGELAESEARVREAHGYKPDGLKPYGVIAQAVLDNNPVSAWAKLQRAGFGVTECALKIMHHPDFTEGKEGRMVFARERIRALGFEQPPTWNQLLERVLPCPLSAGPELLHQVPNLREPGDGCRLLTKPIVIDGIAHHLYLSGIGPTLYAFGFHPDQTWSLNTEVIFRIMP